MMKKTLLIAALFAAATSHAQVVLWDGEIVTAIQTVKAAGSAADNRYFTLSGQQVARPAKGLYIVNGKKVIVK